MAGCKVRYIRMSFKNNVTRILEGHKIPYTVHQYDYDAGIHSAVEVAEAIGLPAHQVYKSLIVVADDKKHKPMVVLLPGEETLELKRLAKQVGTKKVRMATHDRAEKLTGMQTGGISPLALINKGFDLYIDQRALRCETIAVSAGQRGANLEVPVKALVRLTGAKPIDLG